MEPAMNRFLPMLAFAIPVAVSAANTAASGETAQLFQRLETSGCEFERNGKWYDSGKARSHLERKTKHLLKKKPDATAEDVIVHVGTKSSTSGKAYQVRCAGKAAEPSSAWLTRELKAIRGKS
jgi:hypothetical protein